MARLHAEPSCSLDPMDMVCIKSVSNLLDSELKTGTIDWLLPRLCEFDIIGRLQLGDDSNASVGCRRGESCPAPKAESRTCSRHQRAGKTKKAKAE